MGRAALLVAIKAIHSVIFALMLGAILWLVWTGLRGRRDRSVAAAAGLVAVEAAVFVANDGVCPLTPLAERYGASPGSGGVSDIFLPGPVARTIPIWSTSLLLVAAVSHLRRWRQGAAGQSRRTFAIGRPLASSSTSLSR